MRVVLFLSVGYVPQVYGSAAAGATVAGGGSSSRSTSVCLARVFKALVSQLVELLPVLSNYRSVCSSSLFVHTDTFNK